MGGGGSKSTSKPVYTPQQIKMFEWMQQNIVPLAEGKETYLTQLMAQRARDEAARLQEMQGQQLQQIGGITGMSAGQIAQSLQNQQQNAIQSTLARIMEQRQATQAAALNMMAGIPMSPGQKIVQKGPSPWAEAGAGLAKSAGEALIGGLGKSMGAIAGEIGVPGYPGAPGKTPEPTTTPGGPTATPGKTPTTQGDTTRTPADIEAEKKAKKEQEDLAEEQQKQQLGQIAGMGASFIPGIGPFLGPAISMGSSFI